MANLVITIKKETADQIWLNFEPGVLIQYNMMDEIQNIIKPHRNFITSLPGFQSSKASYPDDTTMVITHSFDTIENANNANLQLSPPYNNNQIVINYVELTAKLKEKLGLNYTWDFKVE
jgi:hypothetical protein